MFVDCCVATEPLVGCERDGMDGHSERFPLC